MRTQWGWLPEESADVRLNTGGARKTALDVVAWIIRRRRSFPVREKLPFVHLAYTDQKPE